jgi:hypothetical protein
LFNGFGGEDAAKSEPRDLLPFKIDTAERSSKVFSQKTIAAIKALNKAQRIPLKVLLVLRQIEELGLVYSD